MLCVAGDGRTRPVSTVWQQTLLRRWPWSSASLRPGALRPPAPLRCKLRIQCPLAAHTFLSCPPRAPSIWSCVVCHKERKRPGNSEAHEQFVCLSEWRALHGNLTMIPSWPSHALDEYGRALWANCRPDRHLTEKCRLSSRPETSHALQATTPSPDGLRRQLTGSVTMGL